MYMSSAVLFAFLTLAECVMVLHTYTHALGFKIFSFFMIYTGGHIL